MGKLFGTDGIRGVVNAGLDADLAYKVGLAAAEVLARGLSLYEKHISNMFFFSFRQHRLIPSIINHLCI